MTPGDYASTGLRRALNGCTTTCTTAAFGGMTIRDYESETLTVHWDSERCVHSGHCAATLGSVFDPKRRPWIDVAGAPDDEIAAAIDGCPSGALSYTRNDT